MTDHEKLQAQRREAQRQVILTHQHQADAQRVDENVRKLSAAPLVAQGEPVALTDVQVLEMRAEHGWALETIREIERAIRAAPKAAPPAPLTRAESSQIQANAERLCTHKVDHPSTFILGWRAAEAFHGITEQGEA